MGIKVTAIAKGYYGQFREPGDMFEIANEQAFADTWMVKEGGRAPKRGADANSIGNNPVPGPGTKDITSDLA